MVGDKSGLEPCQYPSFRRNALQPAINLTPIENRGAPYVVKKFIDAGAGYCAAALRGLSASLPAPSSFAGEPTVWRNLRP